MPETIAEGVEGEVVAVTMETLISNVGQVFTGALGWVSDVAEKVTSEPILLLFALIPLVGLGVGMFKRLLNVN